VNRSSTTQTLANATVARAFGSQATLVRTLHRRHGMNLDEDGNAADSVDAARRAVERAEVNLSRDLSRASAAGEATVEHLVASAKPFLIGGAVLAAAAGVAALVWRSGQRRGVGRVTPRPSQPSLGKAVVRSVVLSLVSAAARRYGERFFAGAGATARRGVAAGAAALLLAIGPVAQAQTKLAVDVGAAFPSGAVSSDGWGAGLRFGREYHLTLLTLTPELDAAYHRFGDSTDAFRFMGGGRLGVDFGLEPSVFAHAGVGHYSAPSSSSTSLGYDVGLALDLTMLPVVSFGPHVLVAGVAGTEPLSWVEVGGHVSFSFGD